MIKYSTCQFLGVLLLGIVLTNLTSAQQAPKPKEATKLVPLSLRAALAMRATEEARAQVKNLRLAPGQGASPIVASPEHSLQGFDAAGYPLILAADNLYAARTSSITQLHPGGTLGLNLKGQGYTAHQWDQGQARATHQDLAGRIINGDGSVPISSHSTHTAGTIMSSGQFDAERRGMAYEAKLKTFDWNNDLTELDAEAGTGALVANQSYGHLAGWNFGSPWRWYGRDSDFEDVAFGYYNVTAAAMDAIANEHKELLIVKAAGNNRASGSSTGPGIGVPYQIWDPNTSAWVSSTAPRSSNLGYDILPTWANSKNILVVSAIEKNSVYTGPASITLASFASWGPTDDGRIKPDLVCMGVNVWSTDSQHDAHYSSKGGTSMAAPVATGASLLLQQHHKNLYGRHMTSAQLRGLLIHTTDEAGPAEGPDYKFGWGKLNAATAAQVIQNQDGKHLMARHTLSQGKTYKIYVRARGDMPLTTTICWNDPAATPLDNPAVDDSTISLINDLDVRVTRVGTAEVTKPYCMNLAFPDAPATKGDNIKDNVEKVFIQSPIADALYEITISHKGNLFGGSQEVALAVSGTMPTCLWAGGGGSWQTPANWAWGGVPASTSHVVIPAGDVYLQTDQSLASLSISEGARLNITANRNLTLTHSILNLGTQVGSWEQVQINAAGTFSSYGSWSTHHLSINAPGLAVNSWPLLSPAVVETHRLSAQQALTQTIASTAAIKLVRRNGINPRLGTLPVGSSISGDYEVCFGTGNTTGWYMLGSPVHGQQLQHWGQQLTLRGQYPGAVAGSANVFFYNPANPASSGWQAPTNHSNTTAVGTGMRAFVDSRFTGHHLATFKQKGTPVVGDVVKNLTYCNSGCATWVGQGPENGFNLVANPYACPIDWNTVTRNNVDQVYHVWTRGGYGTYSAGTGIGTMGAGRYIGTGQGFLAYATAPGASITFKEADKAPTQTPSMHRQQPMPALFLSLTAGSQQDEVALVWNPGSDVAQHDDALDAWKLPNGNHNIGINHGGGRTHAIKTLDWANGNATVVPLALQNSTGGAWFSLRGQQAVPNGSTIMFHDLATGTMTPVAEGDSLLLAGLPTTWNPTQPTHELIIRTGSVTSAKKALLTEVKLFPNPATNVLTVKGLPSAGELAAISLVGADGRVAYRAESQAVNAIIDTQDFPRGVYVLQVIAGGQRISKQVVLQ